MNRRLLAGALLSLAVAGAAVLLEGRGGHTPTRPVAVRPHDAVARAPRLQARALVLPRVLPLRVVLLPILTYHRIDSVRATLPAITQRLTVAPSEFALQMDWLARHGFRTVTPLQVFDALELGDRLPPKPVLITFDDGYRDVLGNAAPTLHRLHMRAVEFVITGRISGPDPSFLTWGMLDSLQRLGVIVGSHTVTHRNLTRLSNADLRAELRDSRAALQTHLHHSVQWLAYPFGAEDGRVVAAARRAGYVLALTTHAGATQAADRPLELRRDEILDTTSVAEFAALVTLA